MFGRCVDKACQLIGSRRNRKEHNKGQQVGLSNQVAAVPPTEVGVWVGSGEDREFGFSHVKF